VTVFFAGFAEADFYGHSKEKEVEQVGDGDAEEAV
jgi:hypothetical protein